MGKYQRAVVQSNGVWRIYEQMGVFTIYHEWWEDGKKHRYKDGATRQYSSLGEAMTQLAKYIVFDETHAHQMHTMWSKYR